MIIDWRNLLLKYFKIPASYKVKNNLSKSLLRETAKQLGLPNGICYRKDKKGFSIPEKRWLLEMGEEVFPYFEAGLSPYLDVKLLKKDWITTIENSPSTVRIWRLVCFAVWMKTWRKSTI
jgi:hypothetical protein